MIFQVSEFGLGFGFAFGFLTVGLKRSPTIVLTVSIQMVVGFLVVLARVAESGLLNVLSRRGSWPLFSQNAPLLFECFSNFGGTSLGVHGK